LATLKKLPSGLWQAQVFRRGVRKSASFAIKAQAIAWAGKIESEVMAGVRGEIPNLTVSDLLDKYLAEVTPEKKGKRWEAVRIGLLKRDRLAAVRLRSLDSPHVSDWQQRRLKHVSGASVRRERNLLNHAFNIALNEWKWLTKNPFKGVRRTKGGKPRDRIATDDEIELLSKTASSALQKAITAALETGMRASEIASAPKIVGQTAVLGDSKNGDRRVVPLSARAIEAMKDGIPLTAGSISAEFARLTKTCGIEGLTFHDLRHCAATRLAKKLDVWELCKMFGWKDPKMCLNTYYKSDPEAVAKKL